jgi:DNA-binding Xre family transcriptional regulator
MIDSSIKSMPMKNKIKQFLESRQLSAYQFIKDTGVAPATGYKLAKSPDYLPGIRVLEVICDTYRVQPGELLEWVDESSD